ncbi:hypothetical protein BJ508DRAFT_416313 [Ascobolus immersus RN42]|uniref:Uncharacterized protein n=1 Tax=Ascobolus immersus RN42 TaxID=1160509 RepID=A0A3N4HY92_ASCIM|nr:hypothetical protein BJ508DRAFT_416313 [Ascobolus immersus RN42]
MEVLLSSNGRVMDIEKYKSLPYPPQVTSTSTYRASCSFICPVHQRQRQLQQCNDIQSESQPPTGAHRHPKPTRRKRNETHDPSQRPWRLEVNCTSRPRRRLVTPHAATPILLRTSRNWYGALH